MAELGYQKMEQEILPASSQDQIIEKLRSASIISSCDPRQFARILPKVTLKNLEAGDVLFSVGQPAQQLYLVIEGSVKLDDGLKPLIQLVQGFIGEEAAIDLPGYILNATAESPTKVIVIPKEAIEILAENNLSLKANFNISLLNHYRSQALAIQEKAPLEKPKQQEPTQSLAKPIGWLLAILFPVLIFTLESKTGFSHVTNIFLALFSSLIVIWIFDLIEGSIPSMLAILVLTSLNVAPSSVILSGFTSDSFFMAMSVFALTAVMLKSGIIYRLVLNVLKYIPPIKLVYPFYIFLIGFLFTPIMPSGNGKLGIIAPVFKNMLEALGYRKGGKAADQLAIASFMGINLFTSAFITGKALNLIVFGMLPLQVREQFTSTYWIFASLVYLVITFVLNLLFIFILYRNQEIPFLSKKQVQTQLSILGPLSSHEWTALIGVSLFILGIITTSIHHIGASWVGFAVLIIFLAIGSLSQKEFQTEINWSFLMYSAGMIGLMSTMSYMKIDQWIGGQISWMGSYMQTNFFLFFLLLVAAIFIVRLIMPTTTTTLIFAAIFIPAAQLNGINPWVVSFLIIALSEVFVMPFQNGCYLQFVELCQEGNTFNEKSVLRFNMLSNIFKLLALGASIPFWRWLGLL